MAKRAQESKTKARTIFDNIGLIQGLWPTKEEWTSDLVREWKKAFENDNQDWLEEAISRVKQKSYGRYPDICKVRSELVSIRKERALETHAAREDAADQEEYQQERKRIEGESEVLQYLESLPEDQLKDAKRRFWARYGPGLSKIPAIMGRKPKATEGPAGWPTILRSGVYFMSKGELPE
jgi:hypothetical protein